MSDLLFNPVFSALSTRDRHLGTLSEGVAYFDEEVSPFAGFADGDGEGFEKLARLLPAGRQVLFAHPEGIGQVRGWSLQQLISGVQMVQTAPPPSLPDIPGLQPLRGVHVPQMIDLARRTKPGPFSTRTIEFGGYHGFFEGDKLVAMTGQRMHLPGYTEISAVCTDPAHLGKGYATLLVHHQAGRIRQAGDIPYLHVRGDNERAIAVYERLGFRITRNMNFYFLRRQS